MDRAARAALVRVAKQQARLALSPLDPAGLLALYLEELPVRVSHRRGKPGVVGRAGFYAHEDAGSVGYVSLSSGVCYDEVRFLAVLMHELAHAACHWLHGRDADVHGPKWRAIMERMGQPPDRCHHYRDRRDD